MSFTVTAFNREITGKKKYLALPFFVVLLPIIIIAFPFIGRITYQDGSEWKGYLLRLLNK